MSTPESNEEEFSVGTFLLEQRTALFVRICFLMGMAILLVFPASLVHWGTDRFIVQISFGGLLALVLWGAYFFAKRTSLRAGMGLYLTGSLGCLAFGQIVSGQINNALWFYIIPVLVVGFVMHPRHLWMVGGVIVLLVGLVACMTESTWSLYRRDYVAFGLLLIFVLVLAHQNSRVVSQSSQALEKSVISLWQTNKNLEHSMAQTEQAMLAKETLFKRVSHGLRTPLHTIMGYAELMDEMIADGDTLDPIELSDDIGRIYFAAHGLLLSVDNLLAFSEIGVPLKDERPQQVDVVALMEETIFATRVMTRLTNNTIILTPPARAMAPLMTFPHRLRLVLANLLSNALKFTSEGVISCTIEEAGGRVTFTIGDNGKGMSREEIEDADNIFTLGEELVPGAYDGVGLGLVLCRVQAEILGGELTFDSDIGVGTQVCLSLERRDGEVADQSQES